MRLRSRSIAIWAVKERMFSTISRKLEADGHPEKRHRAAHAESQHGEILEVPAPEVLFIEHGESAMVFQLVYRIPQYTMKYAVTDKLNMLINRRFAEAGINFAFPTRMVYQQSLAAE